MGVTKTISFSDTQNRMAALAKAIGHPARVAILEHLISKKDCICNDLVSELPLAQATISQHLKELKEAGLIKGIVEGKSMCYCIDYVVLAELLEFLEKLKQGHLSQSLCC